MELHMDCLTKLQSTKSTKRTLRTKIKNKIKTGASVISLCELVKFYCKMSWLYITFCDLPYLLIEITWYIVVK